MAATALKRIYRNCCLVINNNTQFFASLCCCPTQMSLLINRGGLVLNLNATIGTSAIDLFVKLQFAYWKIIISTVQSSPSHNFYNKIPICSTLRPCPLCMQNWFIIKIGNGLILSFATMLLGNIEIPCRMEKTSRWMAWGGGVSRMTCLWGRCCRSG